ncbi:retrotransposon protein, putative, ty1-copia subclass [Tanacetum coccineum]|uniref:Retrotransposon protein, putative, ty1-copia subclass n=1 Tax=Tanacetum coccineum TaxID=301880 RepID=A0ABQ5D227_9ASTR
MQSMKDNQVWYLVDLPSNGRTVGCKWLFKKKTDMDDNVHTFKARLVAKGFPQTYGVDYRKPSRLYLYEASAGGSRHASYRHAMILKFLVGVYMCARGFGCFFNGLGRLVVLVVDGFWFVRIVYVLVVAHVTGRDVRTSPTSDYLGEAAYILGIKIIRDRSKPFIALSQRAYMEKTLKKFRMENSKKGYTPMMEKPDYRKSQGEKTPTEVQCMQRVPYASAIGSIMYAVRCTRPDVAFATKDMVLVYKAKPEDELKVSCYADASFQTNNDDTKSQTGYVFVLNGGAVDWKSAKQSTIAMSSTEAEYIAAAKASMEAVWMRKFIDGLGGVIPSNKRPMEMLCDNEPALAIVGDPEILKGDKHFQRKYHYIHEVIQRGEIVLKKVHTDDNAADPFTKPMPLNKHFEHAMAIGIVPASSLM